MTAALTINGHALIAWIALLVAVMFVVVVIARMVKREQDVRLTRVGVFVEREKFGGPDDEDIEDDELNERLARGFDTDPPDRLDR